MITQDVSGIELEDLQYERSARISANDLIKLLIKSPDEIVIIDLRNNSEFKRAHVKGSINIPFHLVTLAEKRLKALNVPDLEQRLANRIVVVASTLHENAVLVLIELTIILRREIIPQGQQCSLF